MFSKPNETFNVGDVVVWGSMTFLVTDIDEDQQIQTKGKIQLCNNTLSFYSTTDSTLYSIPCIIGNQVKLGTNKTKYIVTASNELYLTVSNTSITQQIKVNDIFKIGLNSYEISTICDDISVPGLLVYKIVYSEVEQTLPVFTVEILNGDNVTTGVGTDIQLNCVVKNNDIVLSPTPSLIYTSSNTSVATVSNSGLVTPIMNGSATITVKMASNLTILDTINVTVSAVQDNYTVEISGSTSIVKAKTSIYSCVFKNNGIAITDNSVFYLTADDGVSSTTLATITSQYGTANTCVVTAGSTLGYVKLWVKNDGGTIASNSFRIQIKNIF